MPKCRLALLNYDKRPDLPCRRNDNCISVTYWLKLVEVENTEPGRSSNDLRGKL